MDLFAYTFHVGHGLIGLIILVLDVVAIFSLLGSRASTSHRVIWILLILLFPFLGVIGYYLLGRSSLDA